MREGPDPGAGARAKRDDGLQRVRRLTKWAAGGALAGLGVLTAVTARAESSQTTTPSTTGETTPSTTTPAVTSPATGRTPATLSPPAQAPSSSSSRHSATSGGS